MIKKFILVVILMICLSGCTIEYNVNLSSNLVTEEIKVNNYTVETFPIPVYIDAQGASETNEKVEGVEYYNISYRNNNTYFNYEFPIQDYTRSTAVNTCLSSFKRDVDNDGNYILNTSSHYSCFDLYPLIENVTINVTLDDSVYMVLDSNADVINNNTLSWKVTRDNYQNKNIQVIYKLLESDEKPEINIDVEDNNGNIVTWVNQNVVFVILAVFGLLIFIILLVVIIKKKSNKLR